jgi:hypothetical protein
MTSLVHNIQIAIAPRTVIITPTNNIEDAISLSLSFTAT